MTEKTITILESSYHELVRMADKLRALEMGGVDNWEGYSESLEEYYNDEEEE